MRRIVAARKGCHVTKAKREEAIQAAIRRTMANRIVKLTVVLQEFIGDIEAVGETEAKENWPDLYVTFQHAKALLRGGE